VPKSPESWNLGDWSGGCIRKTPLNCSDKDVFTKYTVSKLPVTSFSWFDKRINLKECEEICLKNCFCIAYANSDITGGGSGCLIWSSDLIDIKRSHVDGQVLYVRLAGSESGMSPIKQLIIDLILSHL
jgi:hypothetical protein